VEVNKCDVKSLKCNSNTEPKKKRVKSTQLADPLGTNSRPLVEKYCYRKRVKVN